MASLPLIASASLTVGGLRTEYREQPLGLDAMRPRLSWTLQSDQRAQRQSAYRVIVARSPEALAREVGDVWDSGKVASSENFGIEYAGPALRSDARYCWQVRVWDAQDRASAWSAASWWQMGLLTPGDWKAKWIGGAASGSPRLRHEFSLGKKVVRATAYVFGFGWCRLTVNGTELADRVLSPVNSNYKNGLLYDAYDITSLVREGRNAIGLWLGNGYNQEYSKYGFRWADPLAAIAQLEITFADGTSQTVVTDQDWKWAESPITANGIYSGETFDARREQSGWCTPGFDDRNWLACGLRVVEAGPLRACPFPGLAVSAELRPVRLAEPKPGVFIFDLGQNIAGWVRLRVHGPAGTRVVLRHAEEIHPDGTLDVTTNRLAHATDTYILGGTGDEVYEPRFTYHGFRYVEVTGFPGRPTLESVTGRAMHAAVPEAGTFVTSDPLVNRIHQNFRWTIANNLVGIPTDTAARDERTPCQMDSLAVEEAAISNWEMGPYYTKWLGDISGDGGGLPNWTGDQVVLPSLLYGHYGDRRIIEQHYENMKQVVDRFAATAESAKYWADGFGDWAPANQPGDYETSFSEGELVNRAFQYRSTRIVAGAAELLGRTEDADRYRAEAKRLQAEFLARFYHAETATFGSGRQVTSILPLAFGLVDEKARPAVIDALRRRIETVDKGHLDTGIFGTRYLFEVLFDHGLGDLAMNVLTKPGYPGYADQIAQGATTTWEQWTYRGSMQTHDHAMFSGPDATFYSRLGGIQPAAPGYREIIIRPSLPAQLSEVNCARQTMTGAVSCHWKREGGRLVARVSIPANATARVYLPAKSLENVTERGKPLTKADGVSGAHLEGAAAVISVGSGDYEFAVK